MVVEANAILDLALLRFDTLCDMGLFFFWYREDDGPRERCFQYERKGTKPSEDISVLVVGIGGLRLRGLDGWILGCEVLVAPCVSLYLIFTQLNFGYLYRVK